MSEQATLGTAGRVFIGVDLTAGKRAITHVVMKDRHQVVERANTDFDGAVEAVTAYPEVICAVDAPQSPNAGLMADPDYRARLGLPPNKPTYSNYKVCEYELRRRGIGLYNTPRDPERAPAWMHLGWRFYEALRAGGFVTWPGTGDRLLFEVHAHACFTALLGHRPFRKTTLEGRLQRQLVLYRADVEVPDPMAALEEITPRYLLASDLTFGGLLYDHDTLDATVAAYTAWLAAKDPALVTQVGDPEEGTIVVPTAKLKDKYPR
jgi:predicted nuclease with RNAse H fold